MWRVLGAFLEILVHFILEGSAGWKGLLASLQDNSDTAGSQMVRTAVLKHAGKGNYLADSVLIV